MSRYIDADALIEALRVDFDREGAKAYEMAQMGVADLSVKYSHGQFCYLNAMERVKDTPTADVAPVVRCKDCKKWEKYENTSGAGYCHNKKFCFTYWKTPKMNYLPRNQGSPRRMKSLANL